MSGFRKFYDRYKRIIENAVYPLSLIILPLINYNQGVDISDSTYSLGNYMFADRLDGMWVVSTFLSNKIGALILKLPGAEALRIANLYTGMVLSVIALVVYIGLKDDLGAPAVFLGEFAAVCFCWIPSGILYNYLSYLFMVMGALLLYKGIKKDSIKLMFFAGFVLGMNVFVRIPNITQMALIVALWGWGIIYKQPVLRKTLVCIGGYVTGFLLIGLWVLWEFGVSGLVDAINGLKGITSTDETYTPIAMITGTLMDYARSFKWVFVIILVCFMGVIIFGVLNKVNERTRETDDTSDKIMGKHKMYTFGGSLVFIAIIIVMLRFFWGRGMYSLRYYEDYTSMYEWGMVALYMSIIADILILIENVRNGHSKAENNKNLTILSIVSLVVIVIAPLGSNNHTYQNLNNLFLVLPLTFELCFRRIRKTSKKSIYYQPIAILVFTLMVVIIVQSFGFHLNFIFRDGMRGEKRDTRVENVGSLKGMYTNKENASELEKVCGFIESRNPDELLLYGNCPGLTFVLGIPSAMSSSWSDLDSNPLSLIEEDLSDLERKINTDQDYSMIAVIRETQSDSILYAQKKEMVEDFLNSNDFYLALETDGFRVYER